MRQSLGFNRSLNVSARMTTCSYRRCFHICCLIIIIYVCDFMHGHYRYIWIRLDKAGESGEDRDKSDIGVEVGLFRNTFFCGWCHWAVNPNKGWDLRTMCFSFWKISTAVSSTNFTSSGWNPDAGASQVSYWIMVRIWPKCSDPAKLWNHSIKPVHNQIVTEFGLDLILRKQKFSLKETRVYSIKSKVHRITIL